MDNYRVVFFWLYRLSLFYCMSFIISWRSCILFNRSARVDPGYWFDDDFILLRPNKKMSRIIIVCGMMQLYFMMSNVLVRDAIRIILTVKSKFCC